MKKTQTVTITEANQKAFVDNYKFSVGDYVYMNNHGEPYIATKSQWLETNPADLGFEFGNNEFPDDTFYPNSGYFTELEIVDDREDIK
jgi:hypothetical protein